MTNRIYKKAIKCPVCKSKNETNWKYCSNDCVLEAQSIAKMNKKVFLEELAMELYEPPTRPKVEAILVDEHGRRVV